jgi:two-component sensor histidine kinase
VAHNMRQPELAVEVAVEGDEVALPSQAATSLALAVNELIQNAFEHAFPGRTEGRVAVLLRRTPDDLVIEVKDDGVGLSASSPQHLGLEIVEALVCEDLHGECSLTGNGGTTARITIPLRNGG